MKKQSPLLLNLITPAFRTHRKRFAANGVKNVFILSTGRTGTTYLAKLFDRQKGIRAVHEPKPSRILRMWSMAHFDGKVSSDFMRSVIYDKRSRLYSSVTDKTYVESNPFITGFTDVLQDVFDKPIVIHVVRDPRDYVKSSMNHGNGQGLKLFFNKFVPYWLPKSDKEVPMRYRAATFWKIVNQSLVDYGKRHPENYHLIKYEDIFSGKQKGVDELATIIGIDKVKLKKSMQSKAGMNKSRHNAVASWQEWSDYDCKKVNELCQPLMQQFGYGLEDEWQQRVSKN